MAQIMIQVVNCLNSDCSSKITGFGLARLNGISPYKDGTMRFSKWRICQSCRLKNDKIRIKCKNPDCGEEHLSDTGLVRMYCNTACRRLVAVNKQNEDRKNG